MITDFARWVQHILQSVADGMVRRFREEPVLTLALVQAAAAVAVGFGLEWSGEQVALFVSFMAALLGWFARSEVTPNGNVPEEV